MISDDIVSPEDVAEPLKSTANVKLPLLSIAIAAFDEVNDCTDGVPSEPEYETLNCEALPDSKPLASLKTEPLLADSIKYDVVSPPSVPVSA